VILLNALDDCCIVRRDVAVLIDDDFLASRRHEAHTFDVDAMVLCCECEGWWCNHHDSEVMAESSDMPQRDSLVF